MKTSDKQDEQKIIIGIFLFGLFSFIVGATDLSDEAGQILFVIGFVMVLGSTGYFFYERKSRKKRQNKLLHKIFYDLVEKNNGDITLVQFAKATNLSASEAMAFLEQKSIEFGTVVNVDEEGVIRYIFK